MREHALAVNGRIAGPEVADVLAARPFFGLAGWRTVADSLGIAREEQSQVALSFSALTSPASV